MNLFIDTWFYQKVMGKSKNDSYKTFPKAVENVAPEGCVRAICPSCKRLFYKDDNHKECNYCVIGLVWKDPTGCGLGYFVYHPEKDQKKILSINKDAQGVEEEK